MGSGAAFENMKNPEVVVQVGDGGDHGSDNTEIGGIIFSTRGPAPGAIVVEWNVNPRQQGGAGTWDSYIRLGGTRGTNLQLSQCPIANPGSGCYAAFLGLHLTRGSSAYLEVSIFFIACTRRVLIPRFLYRDYGYVYCDTFCKS
jgi:glucan 1,3-beta-glucosidase